MPQTSEHPSSGSLRGRIWLAVGAMGTLNCVGGLLAYLTGSFVTSNAFFTVFLMCFPSAAAAVVLGRWLCNEVLGPIGKAGMLARSLERSPAASLPRTTGAAETDDLLRTLHRMSRHFNHLPGTTDDAAAGKMDAQLASLPDSDRITAPFQKLTSTVDDPIDAEEDLISPETAIIRPASEVSAASRRELNVEITSEAEVLNSITGNICALIMEIKGSSAGVAASADTISETTGQLAQRSVTQALQIARITASISQMVEQSREVSLNAGLSAKVAGELLSNARIGTQAANDNITAMKGVRRQVYETAKCIKRLGERTQEIGQIVSYIEDLSDHTSLLALNASLQASADANSETGFAVVAQGLERLAERCNRLTQQISGLAQTINIETGEVVISIEGTIQEVVVGSALADKAGKALVEIESVSGRIAELLVSLSVSAGDHTKSAEKILNSTSAISEIAQIMESSAKRAANSVRTLAELTSHLRDSIAPFNLPPESPLAESPPSDAGAFLN